MQFSNILITSILATLAIAAPAPAPFAEAAPVVEARAQQLIDLWFDAYVPCPRLPLSFQRLIQSSGFLGIKFTGSANFGECKNFASDKANQFSSGKAKVDGSRCTVWV